MITGDGQEEQGRGVPLDYEPVRPRERARFRLGMIALIIALLPLPLIGIANQFGCSMNHSCLNSAGIVSATALVLGIAGCFQRSGRELAIIAIVLAVAELVVMPTLMCA